MKAFGVVVVRKTFELDRAREAPFSMSTQLSHPVRWGVQLPPAVVQFMVLWEQEIPLPFVAIVENIFLLEGQEPSVRDLGHQALEQTAAHPSPSEVKWLGER